MSTRPTIGNTCSLSSDLQLPWQSAFFGLSATLFAVLLQPAGAIHGKSFRNRITLRTSLVLCATDTILVIVKYIWLLTLGCGPRQVARYVWYERFWRNEVSLNNDGNRNETGNAISTDGVEDGSGIDSLWRWSMVAFLVGTFTQSIKLFACKGIPGTQILVAICLVSFLVMESFRIVAGRARPIDMYQPSEDAVRKVNGAMRRLQGLVLTLGIMGQGFIWICIISWNLPWAWFCSDVTGRQQINRLNNVAGLQDKQGHYWNRTVPGSVGPEYWHKRADRLRSDAAKVKAEVRCSDTGLTEDMNIFFIFFIFVVLLLLVGVCCWVTLNRVIGKDEEKSFESSSDVLDHNIFRSRRHQSGITDNLRRIGSCWKSHPIGLVLGLLLGLFGIPLIWMLSKALMDMMRRSGRGYGAVILGAYARMWVSFFMLLAANVPSYVVYRIFLSGGLSRYIRPVLGLPGEEGSWSEFADISFMLLNVGSLFLYYSRVYDAGATYQPTWTGVFG